MTFKMIATAGAAALMASACTPVERRTELTSAVAGRELTAGPGDVVMEFKATKPLPNAFGSADIFGRTTDAGRTIVRFVGSQGRSAIFERSDISVESNATTMNQTPLVMPQTSHTNVQGMVGGTPVTATSTSTSYSVVGPRPTSSYATASAPIMISLAEGQSAPIQGRVLKVIQVSATSIVYSVN
ncbi:hypothetical protein [Terrihabitans sp. B22-R8]|uniref:hypothetical protein n=1 Tax=Terrihabitans sp. B22-R8 TaxID=3425128 RepID=UPI00403CB84D